MDNNEIAIKILEKLQNEISTIIDKCKNDLKDLPDNKKEVIVDLVRETFKLGANYGIEIQKEFADKK